MNGHDNKLAKSVEPEKEIMGREETDESEEEVTDDEEEEEKKGRDERKANCKDAEAQTDQNAIGHSFWPLTCHCPYEEEKETVSTHF
ncbi:hypothetical protein niasHT_028032 [Heterodera trifolii]|uniref:Uncharacterized protein n=1 Tax=Heterodera trifolii TaxID=157864 RepID=A0ABD2KEK4_9BILA